MACRWRLMASWRTQSHGAVPPSARSQHRCLVIAHREEISSFNDVRLIQTARWACELPSGSGRRLIDTHLEDVSDHTDKMPVM